jgi:hypothetical protein
MKHTTPEQKKQWKSKVGSRFVRVIEAPDYMNGARFPQPKYDEQGRRVA